MANPVWPDDFQFTDGYGYPDYWDGDCAMDIDTSYGSITLERKKDIVDPTPVGWYALSPPNLEASPLAWKGFKPTAIIIEGSAGLADATVGSDFTGADYENFADPVVTPGTPVVETILGGTRLTIQLTWNPAAGAEATLRQMYLGGLSGAPSICSVTFEPADAPVLSCFWTTKIRTVEVCD